MSVSPKISASSWIGLCGVSFFLAEVSGVTMPFINIYLRDSGWRYDAIGAVAALAGFTSLLMTLPGGMLIDWTTHRRLLLAATSLFVGTAIGLMPLVPATTFFVGGFLLAAAIGTPLFSLMTNALTLDLSGYQHLDRMMGVNQAWNHAGNIAAAGVAMFLVQWWAPTSVFFATAAASVLAAFSVWFIRPADLRIHQSGETPVSPGAAIRIQKLLSDRRIAVLLGSAMLFHLANGPAMPLLAQKMTVVGGGHGHVAALVMMAQLVMVPSALFAGKLGPSFGHKRILTVGFAVLPIRMLLYSLTDDPGLLVLLQGLDGIGVGILDVTMIALCAEATRGRGHFNALCGVLAMAVGLGAVLGTVVGGLVLQQFGFSAAFLVFAAIAGVAAVVFVQGMPDRDTERRIQASITTVIDLTTGTKEPSPALPRLEVPRFTGME